MNPYGPAMNNTRAADATALKWGNVDSPRW